MEFVAILILLELTLQLNKREINEIIEKGRNPYFIGINSAIIDDIKLNYEFNGSQSLFYWN